MKHKFEKLTHCEFTGRKFKRPEYLYRGFRFQSKPATYGYWRANQQNVNDPNVKAQWFSHNTRRAVQFYVDNFLDGEEI